MSESAPGLSAAQIVTIHRARALGGVEGEVGGAQLRGDAFGVERLGLRHRRVVRVRWGGARPSGSRARAPRAWRGHDSVALGHSRRGQWRGSVRMSDVDELLAAFEAGTLLRPAVDVPNLVDLARACAAVAGADGLKLTAAAGELAEVLDAREHLVLVLADGLGLEMLEREPAAPFLRAHLARELRGVFPASTAVALTSLATGEWPAQHAVTGWWTHLEEIGGPATILQYCRRSDDRPLHDLGVEPETAFPVPSLLPRMRRRTLCLMPRAITGSVYTSYWTGGKPTTGYASLEEAFAAVGDAIYRRDGRTFSYVYAPHVDQAAHQGGPDSREVRNAVIALDRLVQGLAGELGDAARVLLTSDHGHLGVPPGERLLIRPADGIPEMLAFAPAGDSRSVQFHVREGEAERFAARFRERFGEWFYLLSPSWRIWSCWGRGRWRPARGRASASSWRSPGARRCWATSRRAPHARRCSTARTTRG